MATNTYTQLANITLASTATSVTFSSISQSYKDLIVVINAGNSSNSYNGIRARFNSDSGSNYVSMYMLGNGSSTTGTTETLTNGFFGASGGSGSSSVINVMGYSSTTRWKTILGSRNAGDASGYTTGLEGMRWASTSAITSINISDQNGYSFDAGSTFTLYGIDG